MGTNKLSGWIARVPVWVWLFLATTQALNLAVAPSKFVHINEGLQHLTELEGIAGDQDLADHLAMQRGVLESLRRDQWSNVIAAVILLPTFLIAAWWQWERKVVRRNDCQARVSV